MYYILVMSQEKKRIKKINGVFYRLHPVCDLYGADRKGNVINTIEKVPLKGHNHNSGYLYCSVRSLDRSVKKTCSVHRFIYECYYGIIPKGKVIDHINNDKEDNRIKNLQLMTQQQNCKKSAKDRNYTFAAENHKNRKYVKATNIITEEVSYYNSLYATQQHLGINAGIVSMCCQGINHAKSGISKKDGQQYKFEYVKKEDLPNDYKKSANKRPKMPDEEKKKRQREHIKKWQKMEYICEQCGKTLKNGSRYLHNKTCK